MGARSLRLVRALVKKGNCVSNRKEEKMGRGPKTSLLVPSLVETAKLKAHPAYYRALAAYQDSSKGTHTTSFCARPLMCSREHLYRNHLLDPHLCLRCQVTFGSDQELREHSRALQPCQVSRETDIEGITPEQAKALKSKKRHTKDASSELEKWKHIYEILFPGEKPPSPCKSVSWNFD